MKIAVLEQSTAINCPAGWMLRSLRRVARRAKQLQVLWVIAAPERQRNDVVDVVTPADMPAAASASTTLHLEQGGNVGFRVAAGCAFLTRPPPFPDASRQCRVAPAPFRVGHALAFLVPPIPYGRQRQLPLTVLLVVRLPR